MSRVTEFAMARTRALMTETERELIAGEGTDQRRYEAVSRVRSRVKEELTTDVEILEEHHPDLLEELREVVCGGVHTAAGPIVDCPECAYEDHEATVRAHAQEQHGFSNKELNEHFGHEHPLSSEHYTGDGDA